MPLYQTQTTSFKAELPQGIHNLLVDTIKLALYDDNSSLDETTTVYTVTDEVSGGGYTAGGIVLTGVTINSSGSTAYVSFDNPVWSPASFTAAGGLIYNASKANRSIAVLSFGSNKTATNTFTIEMPPNTVSSALLRFT
jgi:hypothetical protein